MQAVFLNPLPPARLCSCRGRLEPCASALLTRALGASCSTSDLSPNGNLAVVARTREDAPKLWVAPRNTPHWARVKAQRVDERVLSTCAAHAARTSSLLLLLLLLPTARPLVAPINVKDLDRLVR